MTAEIYIAGATLWLAGAITWIVVLLTDNGGRRPEGCGRRGCRRSDGWQGCNHGRRAEGVAPGFSWREKRWD